MKADFKQMGADIYESAKAGTGICWVRTSLSLCVWGKGKFWDHCFDKSCP